MKPSALPRIGILLVLFEGSALAQTSPAATERAKQLFEQATTELDAGKYDVACPKLLEVTRLVPEGVGAKETLAECHEKQGKLASAWRQYTAAEALARKQKKLDRAEEASRHAAALVPRLASVVVEAPSGVAGAVLAIDGETAPDAPWGKRQYVDAGAHEIRVSAPGFAPFTTTVRVTGNATVKVPVPALSPAPTDGAGDPANRGNDGEKGADDKAAPVNLRFVGGIAAVALGVSSAVAGIASSLRVQDAQSVLDEYRGRVPAGKDTCALKTGPVDEERISEACGAGAFVPLQFVFYGLGAALTGTGLYLLLAPQPKPSAAPALRIDPAVGPNGASLSVSGHW